VLISLLGVPSFRKAVLGAVMILNKWMLDEFQHANVHYR